MLTSRGATSRCAPVVGGALASSRVIAPFRPDPVRRGASDASGLPAFTRPRLAVRRHGLGRPSVRWSPQHRNRRVRDAGVLATAERGSGRSVPGFELRDDRRGAGDRGEAARRGDRDLVPRTADDTVATDRCARCAISVTVSPRTRIAGPNAAVQTLGEVIGERAAHRLPVRSRARRCSEPDGIVA
jgi:hypothetical protein